MQNKITHLSGLGLEGQKRDREENQIEGIHSKSNQMKNLIFEYIT